MKIILATDGSPCSEAAVMEVARRPFPEDSEVRIISAFEPPAPLTSEPWLSSTSYFEEVERIEHEQARAAVEQAAARLREGQQNGELRITTQVLRGSPKRVIVEEAERWGADLIVVGSHGLKSWERLLLGSVSQTVALHAPCSVEVVRRPAGKK